MIHLFKKKEVKIPDDDVLAIVNGKMIPASQIQDPVFAQEMMGQTIGFIPEQSDVFSPVNGIISVLFPTKHAFGIQADNGNAYLVHIGIDTVSLDGKGFKTFVKQGDRVKAGQKIIEVDWNLLQKEGFNTTTMLILTDKKSDDFKENYVDFKNVTAKEKINH